MVLKAGSAMALLPSELAVAVFDHPAHRANVRNVERLIALLRTCDKPGDYYEFQRHLFACIHRVEQLRSGCARAVERVKDGKKVQAGHPALSVGKDASLPQTWELERFVYERLARQLRTVGDALAWRCFNYDRRVILALACNHSSGPMYGKDGLPSELGTVETLWNDHGRFGLLHDLTNCVRIADITEFSDEGAHLREVKKTAGVGGKQRARMEQAINAVMKGGDLPGELPGLRLVQLNQPHRTDLAQLADLVQVSRKHGVCGMELSGGRAIMAASMTDAIRRWGNDFEAARTAAASARRGALKRAGIADVRSTLHHLSAKSMDTASRSAFVAPWSVYPLSPSDCAGLICDFIGFETVISVEGLQASLANVGLDSDVLLPFENSVMADDLEVLRIRRGRKALIVRASTLNMLTYELLQPDAWAQGVREVLQSPDAPAESVIVFAEEAQTWR